MEGNRRGATVVVSVLSMGASLADQLKAESLEDCFDFTGFQDWDGTQRSRYPYRVGTYKLSV